MDRIQVETTQNISLDFEPGSLGDRILGALVDWGLLLVYTVTVMLIYLSVRGSGTSWVFLIPLLPLTCYNLFMEVFFDGQSLGKKIMRIQVISLDGKRPSLSQYLIRWLFRLIDFLLTENLCAVFTVALSRKRQRLGDMVAGTAVIKLKPATTLADTLYVPVQEDYTVRYLESGRLSTSDVQIIKEAVRYYQDSGNLALLHHTAEKTADTLGIAFTGDPMVFLGTILEDYNYLAGQAP